MDVSLLKSRANKAYITSIVLNNAELSFGMYRDAKIDTDKIDHMLNVYFGKMRFVFGKTPAFVLKAGLLTESEIWHQVDQVVSDIEGLVTT